MARFAIKDGDRIANIVEATEDFAAAQGWIPAEGLEIGMVWDGSKFVAPPAAVDPVPEEVTKFQAKAALLEVGLLDSVETLMANPATPAKARLAWSEVQSFRRDSPTIAALAAGVGLTDDKIDDLFRAASKIMA